MTSDQLTYLRVTPHDPLIARDGRPFSAGLRMRSLDWIYPSVVAGSLRTLLGQMTGGFADPGQEKAAYDQLVGALLDVAIAGPLPVVAAHGAPDELYFPAPADLTVKRSDDGSLDVLPIRPCDAWRKGAGTDFLDEHGLVPAVPADEGDDFKPEPVPGFWSTTRMTEWLSGDYHSPLKSGRWPEGFLGLPLKDRRTHVKVKPGSGASEDGMLFQTVGLDFTRLLRQGADRREWITTPEISLSIRVASRNGLSEHLLNLSNWSPLGGERRIAKWEADAGANAGVPWIVPPGIRGALEEVAKESHPLIRMVLATPALFDEGWRPGWLTIRNEPDGTRTLVGTIPDTAVGVRLIAACVDRWKPLSGWSYQPPIGPKPVRRLVPAGAVYFFRVEAGDATELISRWLASVCDRPQDRRDGFGLALWGSWKHAGPDQRLETR
jgi:CRISPR-associated protein Cmr3